MKFIKAEPDLDIIDDHSKFMPEEKNPLELPTEHVVKKRKKPIIRANKNTKRRKPRRNPTTTSCIIKRKNNYDKMILYCPKCDKEIHLNNTIYEKSYPSLCGICSTNIKFGCQKCKNIWKSRNHAQKHLKYRCGKSPSFECAHCDYKAFLKPHVKRHLYRIHFSSKSHANCQANRPHCDKAHEK